MDWDGTTALSRAGWADLMTDIYAENLPPLAGESDEARRAFSWDELMQLNGRPSIHQMARLADLITGRSGTPRDAAHYQADFQSRLGALVHDRLERIRQRTSTRDSLLLAGVLEMFDHLRERGIAISLASGTPIEQLRDEADLLGVSHYFEGRVFGPADVHDRTFSKRTIIDSLLRDHAIEGSQLVAFGDGPVEVAETKSVGGLAVAVASDEHHNGSGRVDPAKRDLLLGVGADAVIADFRNAAQIMDALTL